MKLAAFGLGAALLALMAAGAARRPVAAPSYRPAGIRPAGPLSVAFADERIVVANHSDEPLERCIVRTAGTLIGEIPFVAPRSSEARFATALFDSEQASVEAHQAGFTFDGYVAAMAERRLSVSCLQAGALVRAAKEE